MYPNSLNGFQRLDSIGPFCTGIAEPGFNLEQPVKRSSYNPLVSQTTVKFKCLSPYGNVMEVGFTVKARKNRGKPPIVC